MDGGVKKASCRVCSKNGDSMIVHRPSGHTVHKNHQFQLEVCWDISLRLKGTNCGSQKLQGDAFLALFREIDREIRRRWELKLLEFGPTISPSFRWNFRSEQEAWVDLARSLCYERPSKGKAGGK